VYAALGLVWIAPELREDAGELAAAEAGTLPRLVEAGDIRGDLHMHTVASDGRATIEEMAAAAAERDYQYVAITDHSQALAMANGLNEARMLEHLARIRAAAAQFQQAHPGFRIFAGVEVDILGDGRLDLADEVLAQLDIVIGSIHSRFDQSREETTARLLRAVANPHLDVLGHPSGRLLLRREAYAYDFEQVLAACAAAGVAMEINASPERLDLNDVQARRCKQQGVPVVVNTDAHHPRHLANLRYGISVARRAWLEAGDVLNTLPAESLLARLRQR
ncbi:MAG: PHP domain-containing protein, partial [Terriglobales bacterium]